jgi:hypothetical protein
VAEEQKVGVKAASVNRKKRFSLTSSSGPVGAGKKADITLLALCGFLRNEIRDDEQNPQF